MATVIKDHYRYLVVGAGNAAGYLCKEFVENKAPRGSLALLGEESNAPYERPALTKAYLHPPGSKVRARLPGFHTSVGVGADRQTLDWYEQHGIDLHTSTRVSKIDVKAKTVETEDGVKVGYDNLVFATGSRAIGLDEIGVKGSDLKNVFTLRDETEAASLVQSMEEKKPARGLIIGGGYIGMETAAALNGWGVDVTMVFPEERLMQRLFTPKLGEWFEKEFAARGIKFIKGETVKELVGDDDGVVKSATLSNGKTLDIDIVIAGIGARPNTELLKGQVELSEDRGVKVDGNMRSVTNDSLYAIGDVASFPHRGGYRRFEHVDNCRKSASKAVQSILGISKENYDYLPYFYSRLFEYTDNPIIFQFYGEQGTKDGEALETVHFSDGKRVGTYWIDGSRAVLGALLVNGTNDNFADIRQLAVDKPKLENGAKPESLIKSW